MCYALVDVPPVEMDQKHFTLKSFQLFHHLQHSELVTEVKDSYKSSVAFNPTKV